MQPPVLPMDECGTRQPSTVDGSRFHGTVSTLTQPSDQCNQSFTTGAHQRFIAKPARGWVSGINDVRSRSDVHFLCHPHMARSCMHPPTTPVRVQYCIPAVETLFLLFHLWMGNRWSPIPTNGARFLISYWIGILIEWLVYEGTCVLQRGFNFDLPLRYMGWLDVGAFIATDTDWVKFWINPIHPRCGIGYRVWNEWILIENYSNFSKKKL